MATPFVTLTAGKVPATRWTDCADMEAMMATFLHRSVPFSALPVENAALFVHSLNKFFGDYILGRVQHHITRYELQGRGSLHAHCLLWIHPDDKEGVSQSIVAAIQQIPGIWNKVLQAYDAPNNTKHNRPFWRRPH